MPLLPIRRCLLENWHPLQDPRMFQTHRITFLHSGFHSTFLRSPEALLPAWICSPCRDIHANFIQRMSSIVVLASTRWHLIRRRLLSPCIVSRRSFVTARNSCVESVIYCREWGYNSYGISHVKLLEQTVQVRKYLIDSDNDLVTWAELLRPTAPSQTIPMRGTGGSDLSRA
jgi:hypothetical protein